MVPSSVPTSVPTYVPLSSAPTIPGDINAPTSRPTSAPQRDDSEFAFFNLHSSFLAADATMRQNFTDTDTFNNVYYANKWYNGYHLEGQCTAWESFRRNALTLPSSEVEFESLRVSMGYEDFETEDLMVTDMTCTDVEKVNALADALANTRNFAMECAGSTWRSFKCGKEASFCIDCTLGCSVLQGTSLLVNPCRVGAQKAYSYSFWRGTTRATGDSVPRLVRPIADSVMAYNDSIVLEVLLSAPGIVHCAAFPQWELRMTGMAVGSVLVRERAAVGNPAITSTSGNVSVPVHISGLDPVTHYQLYCHVTSMAGKGATETALLETRVEVVTQGIAGLTLTALPAAVLLKGSAAQTLSVPVVLNAAPAEGVAVLVSVEVAHCDDTAVRNVTSGALPSVEPSVIEVSATDVGEAAEFRAMFTATIPGSASTAAAECFQLRAYSQDGSFIQDQVEVAVMQHDDATDPATLPIPSVRVARFSDDLRKVFVQLDIASDRGRLPPSFVCSRLVTLAALSPSDMDAATRCTWLSHLTFSISLFGHHTAMATIAEGAEVTLLPGVLRAACGGLTWSQCDALPTAPEASVSLLQASTLRLRPLPSLSVPRVVGGCV